MRLVSGICAYLFVITAHSHTFGLQYDEDNGSRDLGIERHCGTHDLSSDDTDRSNLALANLAKNQDISRMRMANIIVPTYFHVITDGTIGSITDDEIDLQIDVLNEGYGGRFIFQLEGKTTTDNSNWYNDINFEGAMKFALREGDCDTLNIYTTSGYTFLGFAFFPIQCASNKISDGVVINSNTIPGGTEYPYNEGKTLTHEVGHWLGLYHTFNNGCDAPGDFIDDTPAHDKPDSYCISADTCPSSPGDNPINNYMNYTPDSCLTEFTPDQYTRMIGMWITVRNNGSFAPTISSPPTSTPTESMPPSECTSLQIKVTTDLYPEETLWGVYNTSFTVLYSGGPYTGQNTLYTENFCVDPNESYIFQILDAQRDGICCTYGNGSYEVYYDNKLIKEGGTFAGSEVSPLFGICCSPTITSLITSSFPPSRAPSVLPSTIPTLSPSKVPTMDPTLLPSIPSTVIPSTETSNLPSMDPSLPPSRAPSVLPSTIPSPSHSHVVTPTIDGPLQSLPVKISGTPSRSLLSKGMMTGIVIWGACFYLTAGMW